MFHIEFQIGKMKIVNGMSDLDRFSMWERSMHVFHDLWLNAIAGIKSLKWFCNNKLRWYRILTSNWLNMYLLWIVAHNQTEVRLIASEQNTKTTFPSRIFYFFSNFLGQFLHATPINISQNKIIDSLRMERFFMPLKKNGIFVILLLLWQKM